MVKVETGILNQSALKPLVWKLFIDEIFSLWDTAREEITQFSSTNIIKLSRLLLKYLLKYLKYLYHYTQFSTCHPSEVKKASSQKRL